MARDNAYMWSSSNNDRRQQEANIFSLYGSPASDMVQYKKPYKQQLLLMGGRWRGGNPPCVTTWKEEKPKGDFRIIGH